MDDGIFKTRRTMLYGGRRIDLQYMAKIEQRADLLKRASRPPNVAENTAVKQLKLPRIQND